MVDQTSNADAADLFVVAESQMQRRPQLAVVGGGNRQRGGDKALHVGCSPALELSTRLSELIRVGRPPRAGRHHIGVTRQQQTPRLVWAIAHMQIGSPARTLHRAHLGAGARRVLSAEIDQRLVGRAALCLEGHEPGEEIDDLPARLWLAGNQSWLQTVSSAVRWATGQPAAMTCDQVSAKMECSSLRTCHTSLSRISSVSSSPVPETTS